MPKNRLITIVASSAAAAVILGVGAWSIGRNSNDSANASSARTAQAGQMPPGATGQIPPGQNGQGPPAGFGTPVTGATATKVKNAVLAKYDGSVERVMQLPDGSYAVHVITSTGELHVTVSKDLTVTGSRQGGPPQGALPPGGAAPRTNGAARSS